MTVKFFVRADEPDRKALQALFDNLPLLQKHKDLILSDSRYYNICIPGSGVFALYIPTFTLCLGELLTLWEKTDWKQGDIYFYVITGSPLSGSNSSGYWSPKKGFACKYTPTFGKQLRAAISLRRTGSPVYEQGPMEVDTQKITASDISIFDMIDELKHL